MVLVSASDDDMTDAELKTMGEIVRYCRFSVVSTAAPHHDRRCLRQPAQRRDGLDKALDAIESALPDHLRETAYVLACDVAAADGQVAQEEMRLLELIRYRLRVGRLPAAAIERAARARHQTL